METTLFCDAALLPDGMARNVRLMLKGDRIVSIAAGVRVAASDTRVPGVVVPGIANLHSHAFQRAMAGLAERAGPEGDDFWSWREVMYRFLTVLRPDDVEAIATQLYVECLRQGFTGVAEFHYLHNAPGGEPYDDPAEMALRIVSAAQSAGIGLTLLPVLYTQGGFGAVPPTPGQRRFVLTPDALADICTRISAHTRAHTRVGVAPHSLRAVAPRGLAQCVEIARDLGPDTPIHIHVAEQTREIADCIAWSGARPVAWLLDHAPVDRQWCTIHATHMVPAETAALAATGAVAGLCPTTEANLGDGIFPLRPYLDAGGVFGVGTDSNVGTSPVEELRWLEYVGRLEKRARNVTEAVSGASVAAGLVRRAATGGAQALGRHAGAIQTGRLADLVVLDTDHPALVGRGATAAVDAWIFSGNTTPVRHVMVAGRWVIRDGVHARQAEIAAAFAKTMRWLGDA